MCINFAVYCRAKNNGRSTINDRTKIDNDRPTSDPTDHFDRSNFYRHIVGSNKNRTKIHIDRSKIITADQSDRDLNFVILSPDRMNLQTLIQGDQGGFCWRK